MSFTPGAGTRFLAFSTTNPSSGSTTLPGPLSITGGTATTNTPVLSATQTWNNAAVTFTGWQLNVTDTASNAASLLMDLQVGGVSRLAVTKIGGILLESDINFRSSGVYAGAVVKRTGGVGFTAPNALTTAALYDNHFGYSSGVFIGWSDGYNPNSPTSSWVLIGRDAANTLAQRNGVNAQTKRLYGTFTDASNYRRLAMAMTTGGVASIAPEGAGTGASGNVLHISGLPTANPGPGILWNDAGTVKVGT